MDPALLRFGDFLLDVANARLTREGQVLELPPKSFELLVFLARRPGELVLKDELLDAVWGRRFVSEGAVKTVVSELRAALGDDAKAPRWIETVPKRGYRFAGAVQVEAARADPADAGPGNLPSRPPPLIGREADLAMLLALMDRAPLVTLVGPGGVGKSSLALAAAAARRAALPGGAWWVALAPLPPGSDAAALRSALAQALQVAPAGLDSDAGLARLLQGSAMAVVLDNAEHLLDALAPWLAVLQERLPALRWLVTSREPLQLPQEQVLRLAPLEVPAPGADDDLDGLRRTPAVRLFVERVAARLPGFDAQPAQQHALARLVRALDGLPLALELAAARVPVLGVHGLAEHLAADGDAGARLQLLTQAPRTAPPHQRTLRAALDWSHALLTPGEQRVFRRLAVFRGGFLLTAAERVAADEALTGYAVLDAVGALADKSMLQPALLDRAVPRFAMLESVRELAFEKLAEAGEAEATQRRHLGAACAYWARADARALGEPAMAWTAQHAPELDNLRAALRWGLDHAADPAVADDLLALVGHAGTFWPRAGLPAEGAAWCAAVRGLADAHPDPLRRAGVDLAAATLSRFTRALPAAEGLALAQRAAAAYAAAGDAVREYFAQYLCWTQELELDERADRSAPLARMQALARPEWSPLLRRFVRAAEAQHARLAGDTERFLRNSREDLAEFRRLGAQGESWSAAHSLMLAEHDHGRPEAAIAVGRAAVDDIRAAGRLRTYAQLACVHTAMTAEGGDIAGTRTLLAETLPLLPTMQACEVLFLALGWLAHHEGRHEAAAQLLGWFESPARGGGSYGERTFTRRTQAALASCLATVLGPDRLAALRAGAAALGDATAVDLGTSN